LLHIQSERIGKELFEKLRRPLNGYMRNKTSPSVAERKVLIPRCGSRVSVEHCRGLQKVVEGHSQNDCARKITITGDSLRKGRTVRITRPEKRNRKEGHEECAAELSLSRRSRSHPLRQLSRPHHLKMRKPTPMLQPVSQIRGERCSGMLCGKEDRCKCHGRDEDTDKKLTPCSSQNSFSHTRWQARLEGVPSPRRTAWFFCCRTTVVPVPKSFAATCCSSAERTASAPWLSLSAIYSPSCSAIGGALHRHIHGLAAPEYLVINPHPCDEAVFGRG